MRILQIRFRNLNSLVGEWKIDLTHPAFVSDGIFAITGPTGAGKTTILDAICLALYGQTPRLDKVTKGGNEIMSRQTGECFAEVTFETQAGRFRCHWSQHRARKKSGGELQSPKHEVANADSGEILESSFKGAADQIAAATGMDFKRFTQSMMLAQGDFATFLQATPDDRSPILEQITGTEIYSRISVRVHKRQRDEQEKLSQLQAATAGIALLEPEREKELQQEIEAKQKEEANLAATSTATRNAIQWLNAVDKLKREILGLTDEAGRLQGDIEAFKPEREKLDRAIRAAALDGMYATVAAIRKQQSDDRTALQAEEAALPGLESSVREQDEAWKSAEQRSLSAQEQLKVAAPLIRQIRALDQSLASQGKTVSENEALCKKAAAKIDADKQARLQEGKKVAKAENNLELVDDYLKEHAQDEWLASGLTGAQEQLNHLLSKQKEIARKEADREKAGAALAQAAKACDARQKERGIREQTLADASKQLRQGRDELSRLLGGLLLREYRTEQETLFRERAFHAKIAELEEHRAKLEDGSPCPLCGATEHPFATGNVPAPDEIDKRLAALARRIRAAEDQETVIGKLEKAEEAAREKLTDGEKRESAAAGDKKAAETILDGLTGDLERLRTDFAEMKQTVATKLKPLGVVEVPDSGIAPLLESLRRRLKTWQDKVQEKAGIEKRLGDIAGELKRLDAVIETQGSALAEQQERLEILKKEHAAGCDERKQLYDDKNPDAEELRLNEAVAVAEAAEKNARARRDKMRQSRDAAKIKVASLKERIGQREPELGQKEAEFAAALSPACFPDEQQFLAARLADGRREELSAKAKKLDDSQTDIKARQRQKDLEIQSETAKKVTDKSLGELEPQFKECEESLGLLRDVIAGHKHTLRENSAAKERIKTQQAVIDAQRRECVRWQLLHDLIGSADGKKYRNFAQGLTFEILVGHANRQLREMTDRYLLACAKDQPLELTVIDDYQAGEIRSTKNLSGGESFLVSLALALGLSQMASKNVRVDSLFLDEGFGTLDEKALDTALGTLASLRQDGKLIGIISHVSAIKERISAQIQVTPQIGGKSQISGPGCER